MNTLAALAMIAPREIPRAAGQLRHFLRASFDTGLEAHRRASAQAGLPVFSLRKVDLILGPTSIVQNMGPLCVLYRRDSYFPSPTVPCVFQVPEIGDIFYVNFGERGSQDQRHD